MKFTSVRRNKSEKGNALALFGLAIASVTIIVGMVVAPIRNAYITPDNLQHGADAAARAASAEFKRNYVMATMVTAAQNALDSYNIQPQSWAVETCDSVAADNPGLLPAVDHLAALIAIEHANHPGKEVCTDPMRKLVRVSVTAAVEPDGLPATVEVLAEAASVDLVLAIDTSESMTYGWPSNPTSGDARNPVICNAADPTGVDGMPGNCFPFQDVKLAAQLLLNNMYFPYDRVSVVTFDKSAVMQLPLSSDYDTVSNAIRGLQVYEGNNNCPYTRADRPGDPSTYPALSDSDGYGIINPCRLFSGGSPDTYIGLDCPLFYGPTPLEDASQCTTTNIADGVALSGSILTGARPGALPVLVLLSDGAANAAHNQVGGQICPSDYNSYTWTGALCRDDDALLRHCSLVSDTDCTNATYPRGYPPYPYNTINVVDQTHYDADDRARDMFDIVSRNSALVFTVGMGDARKTDNGWDSNSPPVAPGETLLKYGAFGTTYDMSHDPNARIGQYYYGSDAASLSNAFLAVSNQLNTNLVPTPTPTLSPTPGGDTATPYPTGTMTSTVTPDLNTATMTPTETSTIAYTATATLDPCQATATPTPRRIDSIGQPASLPRGCPETSTPTATQSILTPTKTSTPTRTVTRTPTKTATPVTLTFTSLAVQDGWVLESSENSSVGGSLNSAANVFRLGDDAANRQYRAILSFNTAALPDNAVIRSAAIRIKYFSTIGANPFSSLGNLWAQIRQGSFNNNAALEIADFSALPSTTSIAGVFNGPVSNWYNAPLTAAGRAYLNRSGLTQFRLLFALDDNNNHVADYMNFYSGNYPGSQPQLVITYTVP
ncbi:MAG: VWA domain-containing protein [Anaerolineales bacterium]